MNLAKHTLPVLGVLLAPNVLAAGFDELTVEFAAGVNHSRETELLLLGVTRPTAPVFGVDTYVQLNVGGWVGRHEAATLGAAKGLQWHWGPTRLRASLGASLISDTDDDRLSTAFQFYEQFSVQQPVGKLGIALSFRHWSNGRIKLPNGGMNFFGLELEHHW